MNKGLQTLNIEKILFFDTEIVRRSEKLDPSSREFELFQKKTRNKETDEFLSEEDVIKEYESKAALRMGYGRIVSIGVGFVKDGEVHIKALDQGSEEDIINQFCKITQSFDFVCGANIIGYDIPMVVANGYRYFNVMEVLPDKFNTSGKKPWELKNVIDLMDVFKGTHYMNASLDEMCYHFDLPSSKTELDGSKVSNEYWNHGVDKISTYVKADVFASINVFRKMRFENAFDTFNDKNSLTINEIPLLEKLYRNNYLSDEIKTGITEIIKKRKPTVKDKKILEHLLQASYINQEFMKSDDKTTVERKENEIREFLKTI